MKIGFLCHSFDIPAAAYEAIEQALHITTLTPYLLLLNEPEEAPKKQTHTLSETLYDVYNTFDIKRYKNRYLKPTEDASTPKDIRTILSHAPQINLKIEHNILEQQTQAYFAKNKLDVIFYIGKHPLPEVLFTLAIQGIWLYCYDNKPLYFNTWCGFWENYYNQGIIEGTLQCFSLNKRAGNLLARVVCPTNDLHSPSLTQNAILWETAPLLSLCLQRYIKTGKAALTIGKSVYKTPLLKPGFVSILTMFAKYLYFKLKNPPKMFMPGYWSIQLTPTNDTTKLPLPNKNKFTRLKQPQGTFWADPFPLHIDNKTYIFFEEYHFKNQKGVIKSIEIQADNTISKPMPVLETSFHLSFPFIFMEEDTLYLLPEQAQSGELILYKCTQFPHQWEIAATLLKNTHCYDPVLIKKEGKWWLFVTERLIPCGSSCVYDYLYYSDVLSGPWIKHPMNPISTDCRYTRAGGAIFQEDNQLIRVIQDCSQGYGYAINLVKINELSETTYHQELIGSIDPKDYKVDGLHTLNFSEKFTVIDSRTKKCTWFI